MSSAETDKAALVERFRPRLLSIAYRMLGSVADAEDAVQEALLRFHEATDVAAPEAWLVKTTTRLCIDQLRKDKRRAEYYGTWLPEPVSVKWDGAADDRLEVAESLSLAFLVLLEKLSPSERAAFLLREVFGYEFDEIAKLLDKTPANVRQLTVRAKKRLEAQERRFETSRAEVHSLAGQFFQACQTGDLNGIEALLAPDVQLYADGGGKVFAAPYPVLGASKVANLMEVVWRKLQAVCELESTLVNGVPGILFKRDGRTVAIYCFAARNGRITDVYAVVNPDKLNHWQTPGAPPADAVPTSLLH